MKIPKCIRTVFCFPKPSIPFSVSSKRKSSLLYKYLILPILLYGTSAWSLLITMLHQLKLFQFEVLRWIKTCFLFVSGLQSLKMLPVCHCLIRDDIVFLWKLCNGAIDALCHFPSISLPTQFSSNRLFQIPSSRKISTGDNFSSGEHVLLTSTCG